MRAHLFAHTRRVQPIAGAILDSTGQYLYVFTFTAIMLFVSTLFLFALPSPAAFRAQGLSVQLGTHDDWPSYRSADSSDNEDEMR